MNNKTRGFIYEAVVVASYGMSPLFAFPLRAADMSVDTILFYHCAFAIIALGVLIKLQGQSSTLRKVDILPLVVMGSLFLFSSLLLFVSYNYMDVGIAPTTPFVHPMMAAVVMDAFLEEKISTIAVFSILLTFSGIALLYQGGGNKPLSTIRIILVLLSSLSCTICVVGVSRSSLKTLPTAELTFYAISFGLSTYVIHSNFYTKLQVIPSPLLWVDVLTLAILPTAILLTCTALVIQSIGSTPAAILSALEFVTALFSGVLLFHEKLTPRLIVDVLVIITIVALIIISKSLAEKTGVLPQTSRK